MWVVNELIQVIREISELVFNVELMWKCGQVACDDGVQNVVLKCLLKQHLLARTMIFDD